MITSLPIVKCVHQFAALIECSHPTFIKLDNERFIFRGGGGGGRLPWNSSDPPGKKIKNDKSTKKHKQNNVSILVDTSSWLVCTNLF